MPGAKKDQCGVCQSNVTKTTGGILCKMCSVWYHTKCVDMDDVGVAALKEHKSLSFVCSNCFKNSAGNENSVLRQEVSLLNTKIDNFIRKGDDERALILQEISKMVTDFKQEMSSCIKEMKSEITECS